MGDIQLGRKWVPTGSGLKQGLGSPQCNFWRARTLIWKAHFDTKNHKVNCHWRQGRNWTWILLIVVSLPSTVFISTLCITAPHRPGMWFNKLISHFASPLSTRRSSSVQLQRLIECIDGSRAYSLAFDNINHAGVLLWRPSSAALLQWVLLLLWPIATQQQQQYQ